MVSNLGLPSSERDLQRLARVTPARRHPFGLGGNAQSMNKVRSITGTGNLLQKSLNIFIGFQMLGNIKFSDLFWQCCSKVTDMGRQSGERAEISRVSA